MTKGGVAGWAGGALAAAVAAAAAWAAYHHALTRHHWREAELALEHYDAERARDHLAHCLARWADRPDVRLAAARAARSLEAYDEAEEHLAFCERHTADADVRRE